jgi:uncharacterized membrane protein YphA (DoxX/SURF4 family)
VDRLLWVAQGLVTLVFFLSGMLKATMSKERMAATGQTGVAPYPLPFMRFIAVCEILGAVGIILPAALQIAPLLTPMAAIGLAIIMIGAAATHWKLKELRNVATNIILLLLCLFVAWGRA